jgi:hypothetical protein
MCHVALARFLWYQKEQGPFCDEADSTLLDVPRSGLQCPVEELNVDINDPSSAWMIATTLHELLQVKGSGHSE